MRKRNGEKLGWVGGWAGCFLWVVILAIIILIKGLLLKGVVGVVLVGLAFLFVFKLAPWEHPNVPYWKLMLPIYVVLFLAVAWALWTYGTLEPGGMKFEFFTMLVFLPVLIPIWTMGKRRWKDDA